MPYRKIPLLPFAPGLVIVKVCFVNRIIIFNKLYTHRRVAAQDYPIQGPLEGGKGLIIGLISGIVLFYIYTLSCPDMHIVCAHYFKDFNICTLHIM